MSEKKGPLDAWLYQLAGELSGTCFSTEHPEVVLMWLKDHLSIALLEAAREIFGMTFMDGDFLSQNREGDEKDEFGEIIKE